MTVAVAVAVLESVTEARSVTMSMLQHAGDGSRGDRREPVVVRLVVVGGMDEWQQHDGVDHDAQPPEEEGRLRAQRPDRGAQIHDAVP